MTVAELIAVLKRQDQANTIVFRDTIEGVTFDITSAYDAKAIPPYAQKIMGPSTTILVGDAREE